MSQTPGLNPFLPFASYIPDGEPKVFGSRLYLYGSFDRFGSGYCSDCYHVVSAPLEDLTSWTDHGISFSTADVPWSEALLYAPDVLFRGGRYFLFFCLSDGTEGVAESESPAGPFRNARQITLNGAPVTGIDPSVFEDGGRIYYTWGQFELSVGELNDDLCTLKPETVRTGVLSNGPGREGFHEGSSLRKLGERFCLIYASEYTSAFPNCGGRPTKLDYATADTPYGPYTRRGTIIDNEGCDPASWNDHGSVVCANGQWYVFYHASSNNSAFSRRARVERLTVDEENGEIRQAVPTTNGFLQTLLPEHLTSPVHACRFFGGAFVTQTEDGRFPAVRLQNGAGFSFSPVRFSAGAYTLTLQYKAVGTSKLCIYLGERCVSEGDLPPAAEWQTHTFRFSAEDCLAPLRFSFAGNADCAVDALRFTKDAEKG